ncbi:hypothetical protein [Paenibacillus cineris]|uniref:hypothetical protein n=1 Tax=Paenibacillus cineris TaxID=237530 RepID=UPI001B2658E2|nr:hypothetical protein [Paenibacillus cineris]GIO63559.1 hypothetical protein J43TS9_51330 [Paenibacillus cineris]
MRIRITQSKPIVGEYGISHLIGQDFEVKKSDEDGYYISYGATGLYLIHRDECEVVEEAEA